MKKILSLLLITILTATFFAACAKPKLESWIVVDDKEFATQAEADQYKADKQAAAEAEAYEASRIYKDHKILGDWVRIVEEDSHEFQYSKDKLIEYNSKYISNNSFKTYLDTGDIKSTSIKMNETKFTSGSDGTYEIVEEDGDVLKVRFSEFSGPVQTVTFSTDEYGNQIMTQEDVKYTPSQITIYMKVENGEEFFNSLNK